MGYCLMAWHEGTIYAMKACFVSTGGFSAALELTNASGFCVARRYHLRYESMLRFDSSSATKPQ